MLIQSENKDFAPLFFDDNFASHRYVPEGDPNDLDIDRLCNKSTRVFKTTGINSRKKRKL